MRRAGIERRLTDSLETALKLAEGVAEVEIVPKDEKAEPEIAHVLRAPRVHALRAVVRRARAPQLLVQLALRRVRDVRRARHASSRSIPSWSIPDDDLSIDDGAIAPWSGFRGEYFKRVLIAVGDEYGFSTATPWKKLKAAAEEGRALRRGRQAGHGPLQEPLRAAAFVLDASTKA